MDEEAEPILGVQFDEIRHDYTLPDRSKPISVTRALAAGEFIDHTYVTAMAMERGSDVHRAIAWALAGTLDWASLDEEIAPYVEAAMRAMREMDAVPERIERPTYSLPLLTAGTPDLTLRVRAGSRRERKCLWDWKSLSGGRPSPAVRLQTAGYQRLLWDEERLVIHERAEVALYPDGRYHIEPHRDPGDVAVFEALMACLAWKRAQGFKTA